MITAALQWSDIRLPVLIVLAVAVGGYLWYLERHTKKTNGDKLTEQYKVMTNAMLDETPDTMLVKAVVANVMAKQDEKNPQPYYELPLLSPGRAAVYGVWLICRKTEKKGFASLFAPKALALTESAIAGFEGIGANACAEALKAALDAAQNGTAAGEIDAAPFTAAVASEQPLTLCVAYIRENPTEFVD